MSAAAQTPPSRSQLLSVLIAAMLSISTAGPLIVACGMAAPALGFWRVLGAGSVQLAIGVSLEHARLSRMTRRDVLQLLGAGTALGLHFLFWILSLQYTTVASSTVLVTTNPIWVALGSAVFLRERSTRTTIIAIVLGTVGAIVLALADALPAGEWTRHTVTEALRKAAGGDSRAVIGDALALLGAWAGSTALLAGRALRTRHPAMTYAGAMSLSAAPVLGLAGLALGIDFAPKDGSQLLFLALVALIPHLIGNSALYWALGWLPAPRVALVILAEPVGASALAWIFLSQVPNALTIAGAALVLSAVVLSLRQPQRPVTANA